MNKIYYFTGTGNSLQIANNLNEKINECSVHKIAKYSGEKINTKTLGIVFQCTIGGYHWLSVISYVS